MAENTGIEWCHHTFNPWWGCHKVSEACRNCYAETLAKRVGKDFADRVKTKQPWNDLLKWDRSAGERCVRERVFVGSMCDIGDGHPKVWDWRKEAFEILASLQNLDVLLLTKRPKSLREVLAAQFPYGLPTHFWVGCTAENQRQLINRFETLRRIDAAVRFISVEPMLGPIGRLPQHSLDWVIAGGESGPRARCPHPLGFRELRNLCKAAGVPFMFKQWGEYAPYRWQSTVTKAGDVVALKNGQMFLIDQNGQMPAYSGGFDILRRVGKKAAGRELDGKVWDEYPAAAFENKIQMLDVPQPQQPDLLGFMDDVKREITNPGHWEN